MKHLIAAAYGLAMLAMIAAAVLVAAMFATGAVRP